MKHSLISLISLITPSFLTHTVQMKLLKKHLSQESWTNLLNPHGSDETVYKGDKIMYYLLFLTHTVQMKPEITTPNII